MPGIRGFSALRARSFFTRLPLFTRALVCIIFFSWVIGMQTLWDERKWGSLIPSKVSFTAAYRLTTFPFIHSNFFHAFINVVAITPLMERFESEHGTLTTLALFFGPLTQLPAVVYVLFQAVFGIDTPVMGASMWVFTLLGIEAIKTYRSNPNLTIGPYHIPTWTTPLALIIVVAAFIPNTSLLGHLCGVGTGYVAGLGYIKYFAPPEKVLRWIESRLNLLSILPHYVSVDQKTYGRFGVLPSNNRTGGSAATELVGSTQRLGP